jgi:hypothetical protein
MRRILKPADPTLIGLYDERDHVAIQISLLNNSEATDPDRAEVLTRTLAGLEQKILSYGSSR